jgi:hypothetical protein
VLKVAGVNLRHVTLRGGKLRRLDREQVPAEIREWIDAGRSLVWLDICLENHNLAVAIKSTFA